MKYFGTLLLFIIMLSNSNFGQQNNAKLYLSPFVFTEARFGFERVLSEKTTIVASAGLLIPQKLPDNIYDESVVKDYGGEVDLLNKLSGFTFGAEFRYYPGSKRDIPRGFYLGPYLKYNSYSVQTSPNFEYVLTQDEYTNDLTPNQQQEAAPNIDGTYTIDATASMKGSFIQMGGGLEIGYQWIINDFISIDWTFLGLGIESDAFIVDISSDAIPVDYTEWGATIENDVKDFVANDYFDLSDKVDVDVQNDKVVTSLKPIILPAFKFSMISIGITF